MIERDALLDRAAPSPHIDFDSTRAKKTEYPLGLSNWSDVLYFQLWNREQFESEHRD